MLEEVYAENTVPHLLSVKAYARALRAHLLVQSALVSHIIQFVVEEKSIDLSALEIIHNKAITDGITNEDLIQLQSDDAFKQIRDGIASYCEEKKKSSRTAKLWLQYIEYVDIIKQFFFAEQTSNWPLHLQTVIERQIYLQQEGI